MIRERDIEAYLVRKVKAAGGMCVKWTGQQGVPDRIVLLPEKILFVELKAPGGRLSAIQKNMHRKIEALGHRVYILWSKEDVDRWLDENSTDNI